MMFDYKRFYLIPLLDNETKAKLIELINDNKIVGVNNHKYNDECLLGYINRHINRVLLGLHDDSGKLRFLFNNNPKLYGRSQEECFKYVKNIVANNLGKIVDENEINYTFDEFVSIINIASDLKTPIEVITENDEIIWDPDIFADYTNETIATDNSRWKTLWSKED